MADASQRKPRAERRTAKKSERTSGSKEGELQAGHEDPGDAGSSEPASPSRKRTTPGSGLRELQRTNKELLVRIRELELERIESVQDKGQAGEHADISRESRGIISVVADLEEQLNAAFELKEAIETDLAAARAELSRESAARIELESEVQLLKAQTALVDQLRKDISFVEEERNEVSRRLSEATARLEETTDERDLLSGEKSAAEERINDLQSQNIELEARVLNLKADAADLGRLRKELLQVSEARRTLEERAADLAAHLEAAEAARAAMELDLDATREVVRSQREEAAELQKTLAATHIEVAELQAQREVQEAESRRLLEAQKRYDHEIRILNARNETVQKELDATRKALHDVHCAAARTTERVRRRYYKVLGKE